MAAMSSLGTDVPLRVSADIVSWRGKQARVIEVKGRGGKGPVAVIERELATLASAGQAGWLYVVWNATQPRPYELWTVQNPSRLAWNESRAASRPAGQPRRARHEARYEISCADVETCGEEVDLRAIDGLPVKD